MPAKCFRFIRKSRLFITLWGIVAAAAPCMAQVESDIAPEDKLSLWQIIASGGPIGYIILILSLVAVALVIEHFMSIRRERLLPDELVEQLRGQIKGKQYDQARKLCDEDDSYLAQVIGSGLAQVGAVFGFFEMQSAMQEVSEREISRYHRKLEYLSFIATTAPMLGLLGTVTGMINAFNRIAQADGPVQPPQLAAGISEALVTTCLGLVVAIPAMFFTAFFRNRLESYVAEAEVMVEKLMGQFRRSNQTS